MKNLNLFSVLILSAAVLTSGCHKKPSSLTPIPDNMQPPAGQNSGISSANPVPDTTTTTTPEGLPMSDGLYSKVLNGPHTEDAEKFKADTVYFDFDQATIKPSEESKLQDVANYFKSNSTDVLRVEGNCDERGTEKYNLALGDRRALAIREYLANLGVNAQRIGTVTYGAAKPIATGHSEASWSKNRRGDFVLLIPK